MFWYVYVITNTQNGKIYVGKTGNPKKRWYEHVRSAMKGDSGCRLIARALRKYGRDSFRFDVVGVFASEAESLAEERRRIASTGSMQRAVGYNLTEGGESGLLSPESRARLGASLKGHPVSEATKTKIRDARSRQPVTPLMLHALADARHRGAEHNPTIRGLTPVDVVCIRTEYASRTSTGRVLADRYGVTTTMISRIVRGRAHKNAGGPIVSAIYRTRTAAHEIAGRRSVKIARMTAHTPEANAKRSLKMRGRKMSDEFKKKIRDSWVRRLRTGAE